MPTRRRKTSPAAVTRRARRTPKATTPKDRRAAIRQEYQAALADLNRYEHNNQTREARAARERFDKADDARRKYWGIS